MKSVFGFCFLLFAAVISAQETKTYSHPAGLQFQYPAAWELKPGSLAEAEFVPPDLQKNEKGMMEGFLLWGIGGAFTGPADGTLVSQLDKLMKQMVPFLNRLQEVEPIKLGAVPAMKFCWGGTSPDGVSVAARLFVTTHEGAAYAILLMGSEDRIKDREPAFRKILSSFQFGPGARDLHLAANWSSAGSTQSQPAEPALEIRMHTDGTFAFVDPSTAAPGDSGELRGKWYASGGRLCLIVPDSFFIDFDYEIEGQPGARSLTLRHASGGVQVLKEIPAAAK